MRQGCTGPPLPSLYSYIGWLRNFHFCNFEKFLRNFEFFAKFWIFCFTKFSSNFEKFKIILSKFCVSPNFDKIILHFAKFEENFAKHKIKIFAKIWRRGSGGTARQCYFEMKTNKELYFSILSSIILCQSLSFQSYKIWTQPQTSVWTESMGSVTSNGS